MIKINKPMEDYMRNIMNGKQISDNKIDKHFDNNTLQFINKYVKNENYYIFDKYNLVIRKKEFNNKKSPYGWIYNDEHEPINIHIDTMLMKMNSNDIQTITLQHINHEFPAVLKAPRGVLYKIYTTVNTDSNVVNFINKGVNDTVSNKE